MLLLLPPFQTTLLHLQLLLLPLPFFLFPYLHYTVSLHPSVIVFQFISLRSQNWKICSFFFLWFYYTWFIGVIELSYITPIELNFMFVVGKWFRDGNWGFRTYYRRFIIRLFIFHLLSTFVQYAYHIFVATLGKCSTRGVDSYLLAELHHMNLIMRRQLFYLLILGFCLCLFTYLANGQWWLFIMTFF